MFLSVSAVYACSSVPSSSRATAGTATSYSRRVAAAASLLCTAALSLPHAVKQSLLSGTAFDATSSAHDGARHRHR
jgi:hypothetical protein